MKHGFDIATGGSDNHLNLLDLRSKNLTGKDAEAYLDSVGVTTNKNSVPYDTQSPFITSGIRLGTPAVTTRGFKENEMTIIADVIASILNNPEDEQTRLNCRKQVRQVCEQFPLYKEMT